MLIRKTTGLACALALVAAPAWANGRPADTTHGNGHATAHQPAQAKAYGRYCKGQSKKHSDAAAGTQGTPFSQCVAAMKKLANGETTSPRAACKALSKKRADAQPGTKGTPFSQCVSGGAKLLHDQQVDG